MRRSTPAASARWFVGRIGQGVVVASETCAFDLVGATEVRELDPGEFVRIEDGIITDLAPLTPRHESRCIFELVYFARPDSTVFGRSVDHVRRELGRQLARHHPAPGAEVVFSVPDSANVMALGYSEVTGVKLEHGLIRNHYVGRTFINPTQALRVAKVKIKFNPVRDVIEGRSVVVIDDSLVRGTTSKGLVRMIRARRCPRGAPPARLTADHRAVPLRDRHADPRGADRRDPQPRRDSRLPRCRLTGIPHPRRDGGRGRDGRRLVPCLLLR